MRALFLLAVLFPALPDRPNPVPNAAPKTIHEQILGDWQIVKTMVGGGATGPMKDDEIRVIRFTPKDIQVFVNGVLEPDSGGEYTIDVSKTPIALDLLPQNGPQKKVEAILKLEADQLLLAFAINAARPTNFSTPADQLQVVTYLKRVNR